jgi:hypothetical protein
MGAVAPLGPTAGTRRRRADRPRRGTRGLGFGLGAHRGIWRSQPRAPRRRGSTRGRCTRRGRLTAARDNCGEQLSVNQCNTQGNRGTGRLLTLRGSAGGTVQRRRHRDAMGRLWWSSGCARTTPVSAGWLNQGGKGHTEGCPEKLTARRSSPWHWTGRERNGSHGTGGGRQRAVVQVLGSRGQSERESWAEGTNGRGEMGEQGAGARSWPENARTWACPR